MVLGFIGVVVSTAGTVATWGMGPAFGPHWYPLSRRDRVAVRLGGRQAPSHARRGAADERYFVEKAVNMEEI